MTTKRNANHIIRPGGIALLLLLLAAVFAAGAAVGACWQGPAGGGMGRSAGGGAMLWPTVFLLTAGGLMTMSYILWQNDRRLRPAALGGVSGGGVPRPAPVPTAGGTKPRRREGLVGSFRIDLTKNRCGEGVSSYARVLALQDGGTVDSIVSAAAELVHPSDREAFAASMSRGELLRAYESGLSQVTACVLFRLHEDRYTWVQVTVDMARDPGTGDVVAAVYARDVDQEKRMEQIGRRLAEDSFEAMGTIDAATGRMQLVKSGGGAEPEETDYEGEIARILKPLMEPEDYERMAPEFRLDAVLAHLKEKGSYTVLFRTAADEHGLRRCKRVRYAYLDERQDTVLFGQEDAPMLMADEFDAVTGLYNFLAFTHQVSRWMQENPGRPYRLIRYNIDNFKAINGKCGHTEGNRVLRDIGALMRAHDSKDSFSARFHSDQFVRFCGAEGIRPEAALAELKARFVGYSNRYHVGIHMGVYDLCEPGSGFAAINHKALLALQSVKSDYATRIAYYVPAMLRDSEEQQALLEGVEPALEQGQFKVWLQPQVDYKTKRLTGAEALTRWVHPQRGMIPPGVFVPLLENRGLISLLDQYVWEKSCAMLRQWLDRWPGLEGQFSVSVNISRADVHRLPLTDIFTKLVEKYRLAPETLHLEITESAYMEEPERLAAAVDELKAAGFVVEMDDFGAGYSSFNTLKDVDMDVLKLDMKFVADCTENARDGSILSAVVRLADRLQMKVIAEGVETKEQAEFLCGIGCRYMQGYYFAKPLPPEEFEGWLKELADKKG